MTDRELIKQLADALRPLIPKGEVDGVSGSDLLTHHVLVRDVKAARTVLAEADVRLGSGEEG